MRDLLNPEAVVTATTRVFWIVVAREMEAAIFTFDARGDRNIRALTLRQGEGASVRSVSMALEAGLDSQAFDRLILVAEARVLWPLRRALSPRVSIRLQASLNLRPGLPFDEILHRRVVPILARE